MSKAALYAGLGRGLMALGRGAGRAFETMSIESLRERNLKANWARQDKMREDDRALRQQERNADLAYRKERDEVADSFREERIAATNANSKALMDLRTADREKADKQRITEEVYETEGGQTFQVGYNADGEKVRSRQVNPGSSGQTRMPEQQKIQLKAIQDEITMLKKIKYEQGELEPEHEKRLQELEQAYKLTLSGVSQDDILNQFKNWASASQ